MKIRDKITLIFSLLTGSLLLFFFVFIYYFSYRYTESEFYRRLRERANIAAQTYLEEDELSVNIYNELRRKHLQILPEENEMIFQVDIEKQEVLKGPEEHFPPVFFDRIFSRDHAQFFADGLYHYGLLYADNEGDFIVVVSARDNYGRLELRHLLNILILSFLTGLLLIYFTGYFYAGRVLSPISAITQRANAISANNLHLRLDANDNKDELNELTNTFNRMLDRLEASFDTQNNFVNNASHELRNPLTAILGETEIALNRERSGPDYRHSLLTIQKEAQRLELLVKNLLKLAQTGLENNPQLILQPLRIDEVLLEIRQSMDNTHPDHQIVFDFSALPQEPDRLVVRGNHSLLTIGLTNIIDNACKFSSNQEVNIQIRYDYPCVVVTVADKGVGIPARDLKNITEPFYRAENARGFKGFGVGLPLARKIIELHEGHLDIQSTVHAGTTVEIHFPTYSKKQGQKSEVLLF